MFYKTIKDFFLKKYIKNSIFNELTAVNNEVIKTIGILIDGRRFDQSEQLINEINKYSNNQFKINILVFRKKTNKNEIITNPFYTKKNIGFNGTIRKDEVKNFINFPFDLLINYFDEKDLNLEVISVLSNAKFKVGIESSNQSINHFFIKTNLEEYKSFTKILFDYLKIFKKI